jgi:hypothetical protein
VLGSIPSGTTINPIKSFILWDFLYNYKFK